MKNRAEKVKKDKRSIKKIIADNLFVFKYAFKAAPAYTIMMCFHNAVHIVIVYFQHIYLVGYVLDAIQSGQPFSDVVTYIVVIASLEIIRQFADQFYEEIFKRKHQQKLYKKLQFDIFNKAKAMDLASYDDPAFFNDYVWAMNDVKSRADSVLGSMSALFSAVAGFITFGAVILLKDYVGFAFVAVSFIATYLITLKSNKLKYNLNMEVRQPERRRDYFSRVFYLNSYAKEIRLSNIKNKLFKDYDEVNNELVKTVKKRTKPLVALSFISGFIFNYFIFNALYISYLVYRTVVLKAFSYGTMVALFFTASRLNSTVRNLTNALPAFHENSLYIDRIRTFLAHEPEIISGKQDLDMPQVSTLELKNVSFAYKGTDEAVLKDINLTVKAGEKIAIVGHNGAGKTTLTNLLLRLYDVSQGEILYGNSNIKNYDLSAYRNNYSVIFQDFQLFAATVAENVVMDTDATDNAKVETALTQSGFDKKLQALEHGIDTVLSREFDDKGVELSGGEAQKIAIARALYKNSNIIIMDEPSSALDPLSEYHLNRTVTELVKDKTIIFISHRLSTTKMADRIYLIENGKIAEQGTHNELMKLNGQYAYMFNLQAERYRE